MSKTLNNQTVEWKKVDWRKLERRVFKLQKRIFRASSRGEVKAVRRLPLDIVEVMVRKDASCASRASR